MFIEYTTVINGKDEKKSLYNYICRWSISRKSFTWTTFTREANAIYLLIKTLPFYLADMVVILRSDLLTLKRFFQGKSLNAKVSICGIELSDYRITFEIIKSIKNKQSDTLSCLINFDFTEIIAPKKFCHFCIESLPDIDIRADRLTAVTLASIETKGNENVTTDHDKVN